MSVRATVALALACGSLLAVPEAQQSTQPQIPPTFAAEVEVVTVDVSVWDRDGRPVKGLTRNDFLVFENGVPQEVVNFDPVVLPELGVVAVNDEETRRSVSTNVRPQTPGRTFAIIFDDLHLTSTQAPSAKTAIKEFLDKAVVPGDRVMLVATGSDVWWHAEMPAGRDDIKAIVDGLDGKYPVDSSFEWISEWEAYRIEVQQDVELGAKVLRRFQSYGVTFEGRGPGAPGPEDIAKTSLVGMIDPRVRIRARAVYEEALARNKSTLAIVTRVLNSLARTSGRKSVLWLSQGFVHESDLVDMKQAVRASLGANAPIYFINARGLMGLPNEMVAATGRPIDVRDTLLALTDPELASEGAESIARDTGGFAVRNTNDLGRGLSEISRTSRSYYLIGYRSTDRKRDGRFRRIEVRLRSDREGVTVKARRGYYALTDTASAARPGEDPRIVNALDAPFELPAVPLRATAYAFEPTSSSTVKVVVTTEVDVREFDFRRRDDKFEDAMAYVIEVRDRKTGQRYRYDQKVEMSLQQKTRERLSQTWYSVSRDFSLPPGVYKARVVVRDLNDGTLGSVTHDFDVPPAAEFRISTPIVSDLVDTESTPTSPRPVLIARRTFSTNAVLYFQYLVYGAGRDPSTDLPRVSAGYELRRRTGHIFKTAPPTPITPTPSGTVRRLHGISLQGAAPGEYELVLTVQDEVTKRHSSVREPLTLAAE